PSATTPEAVVTHLGAVQAQDYPGALWSIGLRIAGATRADVERAVVERTIVRTWPMRGTLHFVPSADARWMLELLAPRVIRSVAALHRQLELDPAALRRCRLLLSRALAREPVLSRGALYAALQTGGVSTSSLRGIHIIRQLAMERMLCQGPHAPTEPTFALFDEWVPTSRQLDREDALRTLAERYFRSHGPAALRDFAYWTGLTVADAKIALHVARSSLERVEIGDGELWMSNERRAPLPDAPMSAAHLLPGFDELMAGYKDRSAMVAPRHAGRVLSTANGVFAATLVLDARVCGTWKRAASRKAVVLEAAPFVRLTAAQKQSFDVPRARYANFLGAPATLRWTTTQAATNRP
ncbi:MAG: winged helix DNA-binding domain-containing protein, partial [Gemmatimonadota bacterium]|nr:winged helix DNA-binding domain-containing protein [Gemmatimonadota bacterium]